MFKQYITTLKRKDDTIRTTMKDVYTFTRGAGHVRLQRLAFWFLDKIRAYHYEDVETTTYTNIQDRELLDKVITAINTVSEDFPMDTAFEVIMGRSEWISLIKTEKNISPNGPIDYILGPFARSDKAIYGIPINIYSHVEGFVVLPIRKNK